MVDTEEYFPRGGQKPTTKLYKQSNNFLGGIERVQKKKSKPKKKSEGDDGYLSDDLNANFNLSTKNCANGLSYVTAKEGLLILARVRLVTDTHLHMTLPCRMQGHVLACHISEPYNKLLQAYVNDKIDSVSSLSSMFRPGQYAAVRVCGGKDRKLVLSMMPQHVNIIKHTDLFKGSLLQAAVSSSEEHGYVMDVGIPNTRAFMPKSNANPDMQLDIGSVTWCVVKSVTPSEEDCVISLTNHLASIQDAVVKKEPSGSFTTLLPGTAVNFYVDKALDSGIEGHIFHTITSYIQRTHTDKSKGKKPALGQKIRPRLLYVMPTRKTPYFCMKPMFETSYPDLDEEIKFKEGHIIEEAQVIKISGRSIILKLGKKCLGRLSLKRVAIDEDRTDEQVLAESYPIGSEHRVRVLCYNLLDYMYSVTDDPSLLNEPYFCDDDVTIGDFVEGTITSVHDTNVMVKVGRLTGKVPQMHTTESGVVTDPKNVSTVSKKKFKVGQRIRARVFLRKSDSNLLLLTMKPSLLAEDLAIIKRIEDAVPKKTYTGFITHISDYILVSFFNNVKAYIHKSCVSQEPISKLSEAFHIGQIVNVTILSVIPEQKKIFGSFLSFKEWNKKNKNEAQPSESNLKRKRLVSESNEIDNIKEKKKKRERKTSENDANIDISKKKKKREEITENGTDSKKRKRRKLEENEEELDTEKERKSKQILQPEDERLINLNDCITSKDFKKRASILKASIAKREKRIEIIRKKIEQLKSKKLSIKVYKAMVADKKIVKQRLIRLKEALRIVRENIEALPEDEEGFKRKRKDREEEIAEAKKEKVKEKIVEDGKEKVDIKVADKNGPVLELPSVKDFWSLNADSLLTPEDNNEDVDLSSSDDEVQSVIKKRRKKLSPAEKVAKAREEEERLRELERGAIESEASPHSSEQFERALLANPDNSQLWIAYMAFHLQSTEIDKARAVGRKALSTISFREEHEKLNVWLAMLNFEYRFGNKESQQKTLEEALQMNDTFKVHSKLLDILAETGNTEDLSSLVELMMRKYKRNPQSYILIGNACYNVQMLDKARHVMQKAVSLLDKKEHVSVIVQFALLERSKGSQERAETLFEQLLSAYPQRVDVCATYIDMLYKNKDTERIRQVMERMTSLKLPARKMKVLFKKWIEVEEKIGDYEQIDMIRQKAKDFIEKAQF